MPSFNCVVDLCLYPVGTESVSGSDFVARVEKRIHESGLKSSLHSAGTTIEGPWDQVMSLVGKLHEHCHKENFKRIHSHIRVCSVIEDECSAYYR
ncbi:hypothetical protein TPHA_0P00540 [Tetrapisispora phaffii CBS 4417]|uniref:Thiamine-binding protein domain-containing protein n=1 Tax=Tetrapisispora phaffii (strain ATCC 24235 / CBS 4417 / NBRC 1672 / NRRL Y-8282 / UCD 70-5) TaxID=1071381 RepID=G8C234_TETPH|nr:hypothetical protein TPHA_0P00540 [Tetrapisispora phaffii CBS 4417]CCE66212.1 hypothetical protein TPHA_0P00540 [Tetrapisispora phaffii CBS 4417]